MNVCKLIFTVISGQEGFLCLPKSEIRGVL